MLANIRTLAVNLSNSCLSFLDGLDPIATSFYSMEDQFLAV